MTEERERHDENQCEGLPICGYCLDAWEDANREQLEKQRYFVTNLKREQ